MQNISDSPPKAPPIKYTAPLGTRWAKEKAAAGGASAFDLPTDPKTIGPWILGECVGKGASGRVKIAKHRRTGQLAAVKILPLAPLVNSRASLATQQAKSDKQRLGIDREITMMKLMNHPNIMRIYDVYEGESELFLVLEYVEGGELFDFLVNRGRLPPNEALIYFRQIIYGLNYAHTFSIIHRDLKPENILIASLSPPQLKIADWGMAAFAPPQLQLETSCGSPHYASPEIVNGEKYQGNATDIWSCGVILYALLTGRLPFDDKNVRTLLSKVKSGKYEMPSWIDPLAKDLLSKMLIVDVKQRITIPEILGHPWLTSQPNVAFSAADGTTFTLSAPPLPPSPSILGRPILSPDLIDSDLLGSLRVIWGRHADPQDEIIKRDLCAPAGSGVHAKAFYFLLGKYREESYLNRSKDAEHDAEASSASSSTMCGTIDLETHKFNLSWELDESCGLKKYDVPKSLTGALAERPGSISASPPPYLASVSSGQAPPGITSRKRTLTDGHAPTLEIGKSRSEGPGEARPPLMSSAFGGSATASDPAAPGTTPATGPVAHLVNYTSRNSSAPNPHGVARPHPPRRGHTYNMDGREPLYTNTSGAPRGFSAHLQQMQARNVCGSAATPGAGSSASRPRSSVGHPGGFTAFSNAEKKAFFSGPRSPPPGTTGTQLHSGPRGHLSPITSPERMSDGHADLRITSTQLHRKASDTTQQKANDLVQALTQTPPVTLVAANGPTGSAVTGANTENRDCDVSAARAGDKENQTANDEGWSHVTDGDRSGTVGLGVGVGVPLHAREVGTDLANTATAASSPGTAVPPSPSKIKKEKERKARPPPLELPAMHPSRRATFAMLGSPISLSSPVHHQPSSANRILASPVVGEFKGWFSNLFNWKHSHAHGGVLYSADDVHRTRTDVTRLLEGLGVHVSITDGSMHSAGDSSGILETLSCRIDQNVVDQVTGTSLKVARFRIEFRAGPGPSPPALNEPPSALLSPGTDDSQYFHGTSQLAVAATPTTASFNPQSSIPAPRPRSSMLLGRAVSHGSAGPPTPSVPSVLSKWDFPPGCLCAVALVHEKGSMSTFRAVWRRLKEVYGDASTAYPCFSPAIPNTPYAESQRMVL
ncbi:hypothetical protein D9619_007841 [Psilocybe cf. subviscida]|uniref:Protein kinase domain-containing protein n=1 Tax=Psilocybe cf. subviscida TaxID=2480587 RepID=A0A8H5ATB8_9AGAR|nr:hypothetical protein D9619_007841 [Psilocybe cf. subviscida]